MNLNKRIGDRLTRVRAEAGLTQHEFGYVVGLTRGFVSDIERGTKAISIETLCRICKRMDLDANELLGLR